MARWIHCCCPALVLFILAAAGQTQEPKVIGGAASIEPLEAAQRGDANSLVKRSAEDALKAIRARQSRPGTEAAPGKRPLTPEDLWMVKRVGAPSISPDGNWVAVDVTTYSIEDNDSTSDLWLLSSDGKVEKRLTQGTPSPGSPARGGKNSSPKWSPDGAAIAFLSKRDGDEHPQLYVISAAGGEARRVSNLPFPPSAHKWGGDSKTLYCIGWTWPDTPDDASYKKKDKALKDNKVKAYVIDDAVYRYWDKWIADGKRPMVFAVDVASGKHRNLLAGVKLPNGNPAHLVPYEPSDRDYDVSPDGKELCFVADSVKAIGTDINTDLYALALDARGDARNLTADNPANDSNPVYHPDGKSLAFLRQTIKHFYADKSRLMLHDRATGRHLELTERLDRSVASPRWLPDGKRLCCEVEDSGRTNIYFVHTDGKCVNSTEAMVSERSMDVARTVRRAAFIRTSFEQPPAVYTHAPGDQVRRLGRFNDDLVAQWRLGKSESVVFKGANGRDVQMWITYPPDFDPKKKWPLVQMVHGGPHNGVTTDFHFRWNAQLWAAQGWVVAQVNFHGSSGFGQEFTDSITGDYGTKPLADILKSTDWLEQQPWIDKDRMAAAGGSYGGYMVAYMNGHTDRFKAYVCHAGVYNYAGQMASDIVRSRQRALGGFPWEDYARSDRQSANRHAQNFKTPTLVIHGERDYRVPVTHGLEYFNTLKMKGIPARLVYFPDENHWVLKPQNSLLWHKEVFGWLNQYIGKGPKPGQD